MATPTSARRGTGPSLMPSPTIMTLVALVDEGLDLLVLLLGEALGLEAVGADGLADALGDAEAVAGEDRDGADAHLAEALDDRLGLGADLVLEADGAEVVAVAGDVDARHALDAFSTASIWSARRGGGSRGASGAAGEDLALAGVGLDAPAVEFLVVVDLGGGDAGGLRGPHDRRRERVVGGLLGVGGAGEQVGALDALGGGEAADLELSRW
jgi:hypothetical protein